MSLINVVNINRYNGNIINNKSNILVCRYLNEKKNESNVQGHFANPSKQGKVLIFS